MEMDPLVKKLLLEEEEEEEEEYFDEEAFVASLLNNEIEVDASPSQASDNDSPMPAWSTASISASSSKQTVRADYDNLAPPKKPSVGQKKPVETLGSTSLPSSKKQKVSGTFLDQSIDQLTDVTAISGVNLREEEEQLLSRTKEDGRVSEAYPPVVQEEEERLILEKIPLRQKLAETMAKSCIKNMSDNVERCLPLAVEERLRGVVCTQSYQIAKAGKQGRR